MRLRLVLAAVAVVLLSACTSSPTQPASAALPDSHIRADEGTPVTTPPDTTTRGGSGMGSGH